MVDYATTIVTMFFNLKNLSDASEHTRPTEWYLENSRKTLSLPFPMIIFCDAVTQPALEAIRNEYTAPTNISTQYIIKDITEYDFYRYNYPIITRHRENSRIYTKQNRNTSSYFILTLFKFIGLTIAKHRNDYNTPYYAWLDIGCSHVASSNFEEYAIKIFTNPLPKVRACFIHYRSQKEINDMVLYVPGGPCGIAAGLITVQRDLVEPLYTAVLSVFYEMLSRGVGHSEETCLVYVYHRFPHFFNIYYGDYYSLLSNYFTVQKDYHAVRNYFIQNALNDNREDLAHAAALNVLESIEKNVLTLDSSKIEWLQKL